eukprot:2118559-Alexandrium_andersonii.AAC.1
MHPRSFRVPPTVRVHVAELMQGPTKAAVRALEALSHLTRSIWRRQPAPFDNFKGVVKLGFSWCD